MKNLLAICIISAILPNIYINNVEVGNLEPHEALELLEATCHISEKKIIIGEHVYTFADFSAGYNFQLAINQAVEFGQDGGFFTKLKKKRHLKSNPLEISPKYGYDTEKVIKIAQEIADLGKVAPVNATYTLEKGKFVITDEKPGQEVDLPALEAQLVEILSSQVGGSVDIPTIQILPDLTAQDFAKSTHILGSFTTLVDNGRPQRAQNLATASNYLHNQIVLPGETLSVSQVLRPRILENGYVEAGQIIGGLPAQGVGGGICQISSTLYMAALHAEMDILERRNHSLMVAYSGPATDATLAEGLIDLKIRNHTEYPMLIQSTLNHNSHTVNIYGNENRSPGRKIAFESVLVETTPHEDKFVECADLPKGHTQIASFGMDGAKYELYKIVTEDGKQKRTKVNTSTYRPLHRIIKIGTQPQLQFAN